MRRDSIPKATEEEVLIRSRRRCCVCYGLDRSTEIKRGQIAHINQDAGDNRPENLVFLCLSHHDQYDSSTSQSKGITANELRRFREELDEAIAEILQSGAPVEAKKHDVSPSPHGLWRREGVNEEGQIRVMRLSDGRYHVDAYALWGTDRPVGPNIGTADFSVELEGGKGVFRKDYGTVVSEMSLQFQGKELKVETKNGHMWCGMNVFFDGEYEKVSDDPFEGLDR